VENGNDPCWRQGAAVLANVRHTYEIPTRINITRISVETANDDIKPLQAALRKGKVMMALKAVSATIVVFLLVDTCEADPKQNKYKGESTAGYTFYTSHGTVVGARPVHNWQTYDDSCDLPSEGCDNNHRVGIGG
jgi:hypothetical protein